MTSTLYKFRSVADKEHERCFTLDSIRNGYLYFANMTALNDPFEMGAFLDQAPNLRAARKEFLRTDWSKAPVWPELSEMSRKERRKFLLSRWNREAWRTTFLRSWKEQDGFSEDLKRSLSIFCASATRSDGLLWSHYANGHRGIAIGFNPDLDPVLKTYRKIKYQRRFPVINMLRDSQENKIRKAVLTKSIDWKYEKECRVIYPEACENICYKPDPLVFESITFGARISNETRERVIEASKVRFPHIRFERAVLGKRSFSVSFEPFCIH